MITQVINYNYDKCWEGEVRCVEKNIQPGGPSLGYQKRLPEGVTIN